MNREEGVGAEQLAAEDAHSFSKAGEKDNPPTPGRRLHGATTVARGEGGRLGPTSAVRGTSKHAACASREDRVSQERWRRRLPAVDKQPRH